MFCSANITNDYCHPGEHINALLAVAEAITLDRENIEEIKNKTLGYLVKLGFDENLARKEIETVVKSCVAENGDTRDKYNKLSLDERKRTVWNDDNF